MLCRLHGCLRCLSYDTVKHKVLIKVIQCYVGPVLYLNCKRCYISAIVLFGVIVSFMLFSFNGVI